jgi:inorganic pyrophosphatase
VTNLARLPTWADKQHIHAVVETPRGSRCKLEFDPKLKVFTLSKPLLAGLPYPYDWGFVPSTQVSLSDKTSTPSPTARRAQAGTGVRARSTRKGARVDKLRPCVA